MADLRFLLAWLLGLTYTGEGEEARPLDATVSAAKGLNAWTEWMAKENE